jgi:hypothetical protein
MAAELDHKPTSTTMETVQEDRPKGDGTRMRDHWKCLAACTLVSMCPFQYGIDFGLIGGLQAMIGFLQVSYRASSWPPRNGSWAARALRWHLLEN